MDESSVSSKGYFLAAALGIVGGGLVVALITRAIPKIMSQTMAGMMQSRMARMEVAGCDPAEM
jgi:hypothetical protein